MSHRFPWLWSWLLVVVSLWIDLINLEFQAWLLSVSSHHHCVGAEESSVAIAFWFSSLVPCSSAVGSSSSRRQRHLLDAKEWGGIEERVKSENKFADKKEPSLGVQPTVLDSQVMSPQFVGF